VQVHQVHKLFPLISVQIGIVSRLFRISPKTGSDLRLRPFSGVPTGCRYVQVHFLDNESPMVALATGSLGTARRSVSFCRTADANTPSARALRYPAIAAKALRPTTYGVITATATVIWKLLSPAQRVRYRCVTAGQKAGMKKPPACLMDKGK
jgi:hypothetical protein